MHDARQRFGHTKFLYCNPCDSRLGGSKAVCVNPECAIRGIPPKRCKAMKRTVVHFLEIEPQLSMILNKVLPTLVQLHREIHSGEKNKIENVVMAGITFTKKTPTEKLLTEMFGRLREELATMSENGIPIVHNNNTWFCTPVLANGVIDFGAMKTLYDLPRWQSSHGCHLCTFPGQRVGHRMIWFPRFPFAGDRRTYASLTQDAISRSQGEFHRIIAATRNYTYADKFVLGLEDLSGATGSEKDALSFVVFPLAAAMNICADPVGAVAVLAYWILVRVIERSPELTIDDLSGVQELASGMKYLWCAVEPTLFTLKVHAT
ncbi:hypothetical protein TELCIR_09992 [Teladorsagia circumcincta]|uniref:Uncharacterized protein n=1 Tax=Teladorsagia circumcincta TaxID=45464 RepID=A0A2G9UDB5_TELCI|nr:hypothetical protein TELCIR_09992 [Teladorsagia circumcincta]